MALRVKGVPYDLKWYENEKSPILKTPDDLFEQCQGDKANQHLFIEFYSQGCYWCGVFSDTWNQVYDAMLPRYAD